MKRRRPAFTFIWQHIFASKLLTFECIKSWFLLILSTGDRSNKVLITLFTHQIICFCTLPKRERERSRARLFKASALGLDCTTHVSHCCLLSHAHAFTCVLLSLSCASARMPKREASPYDRAQPAGEAFSMSRMRMYTWGGSAEPYKVGEATTRSDTCISKWLLLTFTSGKSPKVHGKVWQKDTCNLQGQDCWGHNDYDDEQSHSLGFELSRPQVMLHFLFPLWPASSLGFHSSLPFPKSEWPFEKNPLGLSLSLARRIRRKGKPDRRLDQTCDEWWVKIWMGIHGNSWANRWTEDIKVVPLSFLLSFPVIRTRKFTLSQQWNGENWEKSLRNCSSFFIYFRLDGCTHCTPLAVLHALEWWREAKPRPLLPPITS